MFKAKKHEINPSTTDTLIGEGSVFEGRIKSEASIRIEGHLTGDIECTGDVIIGEKGEVRSNIAARDVVIAGHVTGNVTTKGKLTILSTGHLHGNTNSASFVIEEGGVFQGSSKMDKGGPASAVSHTQEHEHAASGAAKNFTPPPSDRIGGGKSAAL
ncbi:bactofilin family protein [Gordoniibacillus kamchatkensis]|uniref:bactofilin family protein n=1 Tax=Gordoniibacillus kamchatkensis TaxID=1590651 RepID=UPI0006963C53|nr:polymer-forming cytoskeletal protein [Paenibacillus sp. VKM B-2647]